jgi:hypothetical protein
MAKADPKNTHSDATIQEMLDALWRYTERISDVPEKPQRVTATGRKRHLDNLHAALCTIAKGLKLADPESQALAIGKSWSVK